MPSITEKTRNLPKHWRPNCLRLGSAGHAHFVGAGGSGMRSLAAVLHEAGWGITGSDSSAVDAKTYPFPVFSGHNAQNLPENIHYLIHSDAVQPGNAELTAATERGIPCKSYFQALGELMCDRVGVAVAGTHGKSTVTAMAASCLVASGMDPTVVYGAAKPGKAHGGRFGSGPVMLVEACEYRQNFLQITPHAAVILGVEPDHFDCFPTPESLDRAFADFAQNIAADGHLLARHECPRARCAATAAACRVETFGFSPHADWHACIKDISRGIYTISVLHRRTHLLTARLNVPGRHQALNATAAVALAAQLGAKTEAIQEAIEHFSGIQRRLQRVGCVNNVIFLSDFAHHPTEIRVTLEAVREIDPDRRLVCVFQPHQAGRTAALLDETAVSLNNVDKLALMEIYRAREGPVRPGDVTSSDLAAAIRRHGGTVDLVPNENMLGEDALADYLQSTIRPGDWLLAMGAGDIGRKLHEALRRLENQGSAR